MASACTLFDACEIRRRFDRASTFTVGLEEEVMLLDRDTFGLMPVSEILLERLDGDPRFKPELPAAQLEITTEPESSVAAAIDQLALARRDLAAAAAGLAVPATCGVHPWSAAEGVLNGGERYEALLDEFGQILERQLVASLHVHVSVPGVDRSLAVFNALRCYLPELAALAANAPFYAGRDTGLATVRPKIYEQLPRHGVPPRIESWERFVSELEWGAAAGAVPQPSYWWWDVRPHIEFATLELRVPDAQSTLDEVAGVLALTQALVVTLADRFDAGEQLPDAPAWRIEENRWWAVRYGLEGELADLVTGERTSTRERLRELVDEVRPAAAALGCLDALWHTERLIACGGAERQRAYVERHGLRALPGWLAGRFLDP